MISFSIGWSSFFTKSAIIGGIPYIILYPNKTKHWHPLGQTMAKHCGAGALNVLAPSLRRLPAQPKDPRASRPLDRGNFGSSKLGSWRILQICQEKTSLLLVNVHFTISNIFKYLKMLKYLIEVDQGTWSSMILMIFYDILRYSDLIQNHEKWPSVGISHP